MLVGMGLHVKDLMVLEAFSGAGRIGRAFSPLLTHAGVTYLALVQECLFELCNKGSGKSKRGRLSQAGQMQLV